MTPVDRDRGRKRHSSFATAARSSDASKSRRFVRLLVLAAGLAALAFWIGRSGGLFAARTPAQPPAGTHSNQPWARTLACSDDFPAAATVAGDGNWHSSTAHKSVTTFANRTAIDRVVDLVQGQRVLLSIAVPANADAVLELPVGAHGWRLRTGAAWCARDWRFVREIRTSIAPPLEIVASSQLTIDIAPDPGDPSGFALHLRDAPIVSAGAGQAERPAATRTTADGTLLIPRSAGGQYFVDGSVDGEAVRFLVDTGASRVALPMPLARRLGYYDGREVAVHTAGGQTTGSEFKVRRISFGPFVAEDVTVIAMMNLETPLLGMALLQSIELRHTASGLELRRPK